MDSRLSACSRSWLLTGGLISTMLGLLTMVRVSAGGAYIARIPSVIAPKVRVALQPPWDHGAQLLLLPPTPPVPVFHQPSLLPSVVAADELVDTSSEHQTPLIIVPGIQSTPATPESAADEKQGRPVYVASGNEPPELELISRLSSDPWTPSELSLVQQMKAKSKAAVAVLSSLIAYVSVNSLIKTINPSAFIWSDEDREEPRWLASSHSWWDRKACRWLSLCGLSHFHSVKGRYGHRRFGGHGQIPLDDGENQEWRSYWTSGKISPEDLPNDERRLREIPNYVLEYAPLVHLFPDEQFWPGNIAEHLYHTTPHLNYTPIQGEAEHPTLSDLDKLNVWQRGRYVFLTSNENVENRPPWLEGEKNIPQPGGDENDTSLEWDAGIHQPQADTTLDDDIEDWYNIGAGSFRHEGGDRVDPNGDLTSIPTETPEGEDFVDESAPWADKRDDNKQPRKGGRSDAPAVLIVVDKGNGVVDAFWFYFYSFNLGNVVLNVRFGNHIGDWEHSLVRFHNGKPKAVFFSEHSAGEAYSYAAVEKIGKRPVIYSATGTHAMYAAPGTHDYILPWGLLHDQTDRGPLWDPVMNYHGFTYDYNNDTLRAANVTPTAPTSWFYFAGHWGDKFYPLSDGRQYRFAGQYHYVNGPLGPRFKNLGRKKVCQGPEANPCVIKNWIGGSARPKRWVGVGEGEDISEADLERFFRNGTM
ncbi:Vacuolar protein sorting-associated protein 62 [Onygenales sp. PD_40]|nr:Vacuolar protein sorting-associated protein 62 [Onygenales sp. PD_40]